MIRLYNRFIENKIANTGVNLINTGLRKLDLPPNPYRNKTRSAIKSCARVLSVRAQIKCLLALNSGTKLLNDIPDLDLQNLSMEQFRIVAERLDMPNATLGQFQSAAHELGIHDLRTPIQAVDIPLGRVVNTIPSTSRNLPTAVATEVINTNVTTSQQRHGFFGGKNKRTKNSKKKI